MVQEALAKLGFEIERKKLEVPTHSIKMTGNYTIVVHLYENDNSHVKLVVESEAEVKAKAAEAAKKAAEEAKAAAEAAAAAEAEEAAKAEEAPAVAEAPVEG